MLYIWTHAENILPSDTRPRSDTKSPEEANPQRQRGQQRLPGAEEWREWEVTANGYEVGLGATRMFQNGLGRRLHSSMNMRKTTELFTLNE